MKKLTAAFAALALYISAFAFGPVTGNNLNPFVLASESKVIKVEKVSSLIINSFNQQFESAGNVTWRENQGFYFGYFLQDSKEVMAAFTRDGELVAIGKSKTLSELPAKAVEKVKSRFADYTINNDASEIDMNDETAYYVTIENKTYQKLLKLYSDGGVETLKVTKKKVLVGSVM